MAMTINALDPSQKRVLEKLTSEDVPDLSLVYGPPGTGKSHLIVSLLFELAKKGKKVLFVSQNREALDVVVRKYRELDKDMNLDVGDFHFLDLCLYLSEPEQRRIKYIKSQVSRIRNGIAAVSWQPSGKQDSNEPPYPITYTHFGIDEGLSKQVGLDELLSSNMEFTNHSNVMPSIINNVADIDAHKVYSLLRNYKTKALDFARFNKPNDELRFLNRDNLELLLGNINNTANQIKEELAHNEALTGVSVQNDVDIDELIRAFILWTQGNEFFDIGKIYSDKKSIQELDQSIYEAASIYGRTPDCEISIVPKNATEPIFSKESDKLFRSAKDAEDLSDKISTANSALENLELLKKDVGSEYELGEIIYDILSKLSFTFINDFNIYNGYKNEEMVELSKWANYWSTLGPIKQALSAIPPIFKTTDSKLIKKTIAQNADYFKTIADILDGTSMTYGTFKKYCSSAKNGNGAVSARFGGDRLIKLLNVAFRLNEAILEIFPEDLLLKDASLGAVEEILNRQIKEGGLIIKVAKNEEGMSVADTIKQINACIKRRKLLDQIAGIEAKTKKYLKTKANESFIDFCLRYTENEQMSANELEKSMAYYSSDISLGEISQQSLINAEKVILAAREKHLFSSEFFMVDKGSSLKLWLDRVQYLVNYNNKVDFDNFIEHNRFVNGMTELFGESNKKTIDKFLHMGLDYPDFAEIVVRSLNNAIYTNMPSAWTKMVDADGRSAKYKKALKEERKKYYLQTIRDMAITCEDAANRLAYQQNWCWGSTTMAKIRATFDLISKAFPVVIATPSEVAKYIMPKKELFDFVIFDEASQLLPGQAIPSIYRAKNAVIVGDPHQMPPISTATIGATPAAFQDGDGIDEDQTSILDVVKDMQIESAYHLKVHYRSKYNVLFEPSRKAIYAHDDIRPIVEAQSIDMPLFIEDNLGEDDEAGFSAIVRRANSYIEHNPDATFCILFTRKGKGGEDDFKEYLEAHGPEVRELMRKYDNEELLISTVTNCQGIMGDHTILYIPHYVAPRTMWFFKEAAGAYRRLNVAITRQVESLDIIMGDDRGKWMNVCKSLLESPNTGPNAAKSAELLQTLLTNAGQTISEMYLEKTLGPNKDHIDSPLTQQLYDKLCEHYSTKIGSELRIWCEVGYKIRIPDQKNIEQNEYNVGYRIDIGIYSIRSERFVLGIEMDGAAYHSGFYKEFSDSQRQEILESKGWNIYRIWSTNWLHDMQGEFNALTEQIDKLLEEEKSKPDISQSKRTAPLHPASSSNDDGPIPPLISPFVQGFRTYIKNRSKNLEKDNKGEDANIIELPIDTVEQVREPIQHVAPHNSYGLITFRNEFIEYAKKCLKLGKVLKLKYTDGGENDPIAQVDKIPYQEMLIKEIGDDYIDARFDAKSSHYRIRLDKIIAYIEE